MVKSKGRKPAGKTEKAKSGRSESKTTRKHLTRPERKPKTEPSVRKDRGVAQSKPATSNARNSVPGQNNHLIELTAPNSSPTPETIKSQSGIDLTEKIKELVRLAQEQGYLTYNDINDALPDSVVTPEDLDEIYIKLRNLEVEIVDQAEVDRVKQPEPEEEEDKSKLDILDDPVRMYLKQMGWVPSAYARTRGRNFQTD